MSKHLLLSIAEIGGYPDFSALYQSAGYEVQTETSMRKAMGVIKQKKPDIVVAEFNFQSDFRDRTSSLESMMSVVQRSPDIRVIVFYEMEYQHQFNRLLERHSFYETFTFPVQEQALQTCVERIAKCQNGTLLSE
jgi:DNA-binding NtrC family response regulator